jgi:ATP-dependent DNA helicase PIF1
MELSPEQQAALTAFQRGENLFVTGPGGTGKTKLIERMVEHATTANLSYQVCALTGCAATLLPQARTIHSWSGIKLARGPKAQVVDGALRNRKAAASWRKTRILIVDEVSMMSAKMFDILEQLARAARKSPVPFGGMQVVFVGDFYQLPPVGGEDPEDDQFAFESTRWSVVFPAPNHVELHTIFRQTDPLYKAILMQVRQGTLSAEHAAVLQARVRPYDQDANTVQPTKLFPTRARTDFLNKSMYEKLEGKEYVFPCDLRSNCTTYIETNKAIPPLLLSRSQSLSSDEKDREFQQLVAANASGSELRLKQGAVVMCTVNLPSSGLCNGSQGVVVGFSASKDTVPGSPIVRFTNGMTVTMNMQYRQSDEYPTLAVGHVPLMLAWALTIHKIQGTTLSQAEMDVGGLVFECGQTYVALSRVQSLDGLYLSAFDPKRITVNPKVRAFYATLAKTPKQEEEICNVFTKVVTL